MVPFVLKNSFFEYQGKKLKCFYHKYNKTWKNERCIEIPIVLDKLIETKSNKILEIGNVLSHYIQINWQVIDKFEKPLIHSIINVDFCEYKTNNKFDLIISISTIEHIGFDEEILEPEKALKALIKIKELLSDSGKAIITFPIGYNKYLDSYIKNNKFIFDRITYMYKIGPRKWIEKSFFDERVKYGVPFQCANGLVIGEIFK